jgi:hypothetical protein
MQLMSVTNDNSVTGLGTYKIGTQAMEDKQHTSQCLQKHTGLH